MNIDHTRNWGKGQLCLEIPNPAIFGDLLETEARPRSRYRRQESARNDASHLFLDLFNNPTASAKARKQRTPRPPVDPAIVPALVFAFLQDDHLTKALVEDLFHVVACVAVSTRWASEWPNLERWIDSASMDKGGAGFWCEAAGLYPADFLPAFWKGIEAQRAEPDQDLREVRAYGENLGEIWPVYRRLTIERNHFMWWPCEGFDDLEQRDVVESGGQYQTQGGWRRRAHHHNFGYF
ncbi:hypothetical protein [Halothiobacillus neapolitanus]|uniref:Uncharacterized protein n=1 Tax=Halothiobacillus neapolitanus (strain ATCC 23641 / DSM 15147 / CIP 104769 / NCIMB 8539 / c2) TaxID=555778 RepID=D0L183_HALNC|nr:hypothetical protein [Halothiobacillus neapolitanus]ACX96456.1 hypothetical protein Hneap_1628 [Halothiobacillus neapolitanus c2]TDN66772.1 hypothetical protein C8D83_1011111 [Halothiobacillus neapolitanus]